MIKTSLQHFMQPPLAFFGEKYTADPTIAAPQSEDESMPDRLKVPLLLLKTKSKPTDPYEEFFSNFHDGAFDPVFVPVLEHHFIDDALSTIESHTLNNAFATDHLTAKYGGLIFTSQRAVEAFSSVVDGLRSRGEPIETLFPSTLPLYVVGPATAKSLRALKLSSEILGDESGNGEALAQFILKHYNEKILSTDAVMKPPLLFLVGEQRRDIIPKTLQSDSLESTAQIFVEELTVYETGVMESFAVEFARLVRPRLQRNSPQWVVVFSPTGCKAMLEALDMLDQTTGKVDPAKAGKDRQTKIATIGPTTRDHLIQEFGFEPDVCAPRPSPEGIAEGIKEYLSHISVHWQ